MALDPHTWIIGQVVVDLILVTLLLWSLRNHSRREITWQDHERIVGKSEEILSEMRRLSEGLEANLKEKKELSRHILEQLDQGLRKAQETAGELSKIVSKAGSLVTDPSHPQMNSHQTRSAVESLLGKGLTREEVAQHLGISVAEIDLVMKLRPVRERSKSATDGAAPKP